MAQMSGGVFGGEPSVKSMKWQATWAAQAALQAARGWPVVGVASGGLVQCVLACSADQFPSAGGGSALTQAVASRSSTDPPSASPRPRLPPFTKTKY